MRSATRRPRRRRRRAMPRHRRRARARWPRSRRSSALRHAPDRGRRPRPARRPARGGARSSWPHLAVDRAGVTPAPRGRRRRRRPGGLSAACHLAGAGHDVTVVEAGDGPGGRAGTLRARRLPVRHRPDRADDARPGRAAASPRSAPRWPTLPHAAPGRPDVPGLLRRRQRAAGAPRPRGDGGGDPRGVRARRGRRLRPLLRLADRALPRSRCRTSSSATTTRRSTCSGRSRRRSSWCGSARFGRLARAVGRYFDDERLRRLFSFQALYAGLAPYEALALYAVITYMDAVNGVFVPDGRHARRCPPRWPPRPRTPGVELRYGARSSGSCWPARRRRRSGACGSPAASVVAADAVVCTADLPVAYRTLLPGLAAPRSARRGTYSPSALVWHVGVARRAARRGRPPQHPLRRGSGSGRSATLLDDGRRMPDPVDARHRADLDEPAMAPAGPPRALRARAGAQPRRPRSTGRPSATPARDDLAAAGRAVRLPDRRRGRGARRPARLGGPGHGAGHAVRAVAPVLPDRAVPARPTSSAGRPAWCSPAPAPCPASACRWCSCRASCAADAGRRPGRRRCAADERHARGVLRPLPRAQPAARHDLLLVHARPAAGEAPPRVGAVRVLPVRRRHRRRPRRPSPADGAPRPRSTRPRRPVLRRPRRRADSDDPVLRGGGPHRAGLRHRPELLRALPALDGDGPDGRRVRRPGTTCSATWTARPR